MGVWLHDQIVAAWASEKKLYILYIKSLGCQNFSNRYCIVQRLLIKEGSVMRFKLVIYTSKKVIYMIVSEEELDSIYIQYQSSNIFILNIIQ